MKVNILGVLIDNLTQSQALEKLEGYLTSVGKHYVVTPNPEMVVMSQKDLEFKKILNGADIAIPDGFGLIWAARILGLDLSCRVAGTDVVEKVCQKSAARGFKIFFLGAKEGVAERAKKRLEAKYPGVKIIGTLSGNPELAADYQTQTIINQCGQIDFLMVAFGAPYQEKWIQRNLSKLKVKVAIGVGGALDYLAGDKKRPPFWIRKMGFEWFFRLLSEPWRFKRQLRLPYFIFLVLKEKMSHMV